MTLVQFWWAKYLGFQLNSRTSCQTKCIKLAVMLLRFLKHQIWARDLWEGLWSVECSDVIITKNCLFPILPTIIFALISRVKIQSWRPLFGAVAWTRGMGVRTTVTVLGSWVKAGSSPCWVKQKWHHFGDWLTAVASGLMRNHFEWTELLAYGRCS